MLLTNKIMTENYLFTSSVLHASHKDLKKYEKCRDTIFSFIAHSNLVNIQTLKRETILILNNYTILTAWLRKVDMQDTFPAQ